MGIFTWLKVGALVAALLIGAGGAGYVQQLRLNAVTADNAMLVKKLSGYKRALKIMKDDLKTDEETEDAKVDIDNLTPEQLAAYFDKLRQRAAGTRTPADSEETDD